MTLALAILAVAIPAVALPAVATPALPGQAATTLTAPLAVSVGGAELVDARHRLAWSRCPAGADWQADRCAGKALLLSLPEAGVFAAELGRLSGHPYRLPTLQELIRLGEQLQLASLHLAGDGKSGETTPGWYWTSTPCVGAPAQENPYRYDNVMRRHDQAGPVAPPIPLGCAVSLRSGGTRGDMPRGARLRVLLVRSDDNPPSSPAARPPSR